MNTLLKSLNTNEQERISVLADAFLSEGFAFNFVGGAVRDCLAGRAPHDVDITTDAAPARMAEIGQKYGIDTDTKDARFGTVIFTVRTASGASRLEVTAYRTDGTYTDGRHPDGVSLNASLTEDLARRDLTINAMAMDMDGTLTDPFGGADDLREGIIRAVGDPRARIREDGIRALRALRFAAVFGFTLTQDLTDAVAQADLSGVSKERIRTEFDKILLSDHVDTVADALSRTGILGTMAGFAGTSLRRNADVAGTARYLAALSCEPFERLAALNAVISDMGAFMDYYSYGRKVRKRAFQMM